MASKKKTKIKERGNKPACETIPGEPVALEYPRRRTILVLSAILLLTVIVFSASINNGFIKWDDDKNVYENVYIRDINLTNIKVFFTKPLLSMYTPLVYLSYAIDYKIAGLNPKIYHLTNLMLHLVNIALVFFLIKLFTQRLGIAAIVALFFAIHPLNVDAVAPVSIRSSLLYSLFYLAAYLCYILYIKNNLKIKYLVLALILFILSLLSKSAAVVLPVLLFLTDYYYKRKLDFKTVMEKIPFLAFSIIIGVLTIIFREDTGYIGSPYVFNFIDRIFLVCYSAAFYVVKLLLPINLSAIYPYPDKISGILPIEFYLSPLVILLVLFGLYKARKNRELIFGALFFLVNILLVLKIIPLGFELVCDRYAYIPYIGLFMIIGVAFSRLSDSTNAAAGKIKICFVVSLIGTAVLFSVVSYNRSIVWKDSLSLFGDVLEKYPTAYQAYNNRGIVKKEQNDYGGAMADYNRAITLNPNFAEAYYNRGIAKKEQNDYVGAMADYNNAIALKPDYADAYNNRGIAKKEQNDYVGAMADFNMALRLKLDYALAYNNRGSIKLFQKDYAGAVADYDSAIELGPQDAITFYNRGVAKLLLGDRDGACTDWRKYFVLGGKEEASSEVARRYCP